MYKFYIENSDGKHAGTDLRFLNYVYAHGWLDTDGDFLHEEKDSFDKRRNYDGEPCIAVLPDGTEKEALLFFWKSTHVYIHKLWFCGEHRQICKQQHGLVVDKDDKDSITYAHECFNARVKGL